MKGLGVQVKKTPSNVEKQVFFGQDGAREDRRESSETSAH